MPFGLTTSLLEAEVVCGAAALAVDVFFGGGGVSSQPNASAPNPRARSAMGNAEMRGRSRFMARQCSRIATRNTSPDVHDGTATARQAGRAAPQPAGVSLR